MATKTVIAPAPNPAVAAYAAPYAAEGPLIAGTSITPNPVDAVTAKTFSIVEYNRTFNAGARIRATAVGFTDTFCEGVVTAWDGQVVTFTPDLAHNASATIYSNWSITVAGQPGIQGIQGSTGPQGPSGGPVGPTGPAGAPGSVWRNGTGAPLNSLGADGDYYLNDTTSDVYLRASSIYSIVANIKGNTGATGATGAVGPTGPQGIIADAPSDGGYYARRNASWQTPPGGGNVSVSGTPTAGQLASWTSANTIQGINPPTYGNVLTSGTPAVNQWAQWVDGTHIQGVAASATPWVQKAGDTMTGTFEVSFANPIINVRKAASGQAASINGYTGTGAASLRWGVFLGDNTAESGGNAGSTFVLQAYDDTGAALSPPALSIPRGTRLATVAGDPTAPLGIATKQYVDATGARRFGGQLSRLSATSLKFAPYNGSLIMINGVAYAIPAAGIAGLGNTAVFINGVSGNLAASTRYFVYAFNNAGIITADYSTTTHVTSATAGNIGTEIKSGDDTRSLIGQIYANAAGQFEDSPTNRYVLSWLNRKNKSVSQVLATTVTGIGGNVWASYLPPANFLVWAGDEVEYSFVASVSEATNNSTYIGVGFDSLTVATEYPVAFGGLNNNWNSCMVGGSKSGLTEGFHYAAGLVATPGTGSIGGLDGWTPGGIHPVTAPAVITVTVSG